jgi:hypothetical protein
LSRTAATGRGEANRRLAQEQGREFRLGVYYSTAKKRVQADYVLVGQAFWAFVGGHPDTQQQVFELLRGKGRAFSIRSIVANRTRALVAELKS